MIKGDKYFHQRHIFIKTAKPILILLMMSESNHRHMDKPRFMVLMVDDYIKMSMPELNDEDYFHPVTKSEDDENEEGPGDDDPSEYLSDDEDVSNTEYGITSQDKNRFGGKILAVWERYTPLLDHDYYREGYMLSVDAKTYYRAKVSVLYIYVNYHVIFLQFFILKRI